jgi:hypothetical protein
VANPLSPEGEIENKAFTPLRALRETHLRMKTIRAFVANPHPPKGKITHLKFIEEGKTRILQLD